MMPNFWQLPTKGQLISKCLFGIFTFFQKPNENKSTSSKVELFVRFLEETSAWKNHFEIVWPLEKWQYFFFCFCICFFLYSSLQYIMISYILPRYYLYDLSWNGLRAIKSAKCCRVFTFIEMNLGKKGLLGIYRNP